MAVRRCLGLACPASSRPSVGTSAYSVSYKRQHRGDGAEIFTLKKLRHAKYWMAQAFLVLLAIRNSDGEVRWMEAREREREEGGKDRL